MTDKQTPADWVLIEAAKRSGWGEYESTNGLRIEYGLDRRPFTALCDMIEREADPVNAATVLYQHACNMAAGLARAGDFEGYKESAWFKLANAIHDAMPNAIEAGEHHDRGHARAT